jgi:Sec-independent protein translocase protein TatA
MGDMAKGIKSFKAGMAEDVAVADKSTDAMPGDDAKPVQASVAKDDTADETAKS